MKTETNKQDIICLGLPMKIIKRLDAHAKSTYVTRSGIVRGLIIQYLATLDRATEQVSK